MWKTGGKTYDAVIPGRSLALRTPRNQLFVVLKTNTRIDVEVSIY